MKKTIETGWTARDDRNIKSFAVLHGGEFKLDLEVRLEISNSHNKVLFIQEKFSIEEYVNDNLVGYENI